MRSLHSKTNDVVMSLFPSNPPTCYFFYKRNFSSSKHLAVRGELNENGRKAFNLLPSFSSIYISVSMMEERQREESLNIIDSLNYLLIHPKCLFSLLVCFPFFLLPLHSLISTMCAYVCFAFFADCRQEICNLLCSR